MKALLKGEPCLKRWSIRPALAASAASAALGLLATAAMAAGSDWQTSGHDLGGQRYSPLTQINKSNVSKLGIAWTYHMTPAGYTGRASSTSRRPRSWALRRTIRMASPRYR
jgi:hypothetical protein